MNTVITQDKTELYVKDWGAGQPVILMHGWPLTSDTWDDQAISLAQSGFRTIAYDRRGFGRSSQPWSGYDYDTFADDLAAVISQTGAQNAILVGFSMGGGEVARYLSRHGGNSIAKAVLISSVVPFMLKTQDNPGGIDQSAFDQMAQAMQQDRAKFFTGFFKDFFGVGLVSRPVSDEVLTWTHNMAMQASLRATLESAKAFAGTDFRVDLPSFTMPTLIIHGTADKTVPFDNSGRAAANAIARSTLIAYDGAPHGLFATDKDRLTKDLLDFLRA